MYIYRALPAHCACCNYSILRHIDRNDFGHYAAFTRETISVVCAFLYLGAERHADTASIVFLLDFLPRVLPVKISDSSCIIIALIINASSYVAEVIRAGIQAVDKGQTEAARSLGMTGSHTMTQIILPQAIKNILPALGNEFITMIKQASLASVFFINELTTSYKTISSATFRPVEALMIAGIIYLMVTTVLGKIMEYAEWRMNRNER